MLSSDQNAELKVLAVESLDEAERIWKKVGSRMAILAESAQFSKALESDIPGHPYVEFGDPKVDEFIAIAVDMRDSHGHILVASSDTEVELVQRAFYESSVLLPTIAKVISFKKGSVTEYLGDGVLGLFLASGEQKVSAIYDSYNAAVNCLHVLHDVVNPLLDERYGLPDLEIGIGLALNTAVVTLVGLPESRHPKAFGECVYRATKLAKGRNEIYIDDTLRYSWPTEKGGKLLFSKKSVRGIDGYLVGDPELPY
jgi:class 3 adenylate cyclase